MTNFFLLARSMIFFYLHFLGNKTSILLLLNDILEDPFYFVCFIFKRNTGKISKYFYTERELLSFVCFKLHELNVCILNNMMNRCHFKLKPSFNFYVKVNK